MLRTVSTCFLLLTTSAITVTATRSAGVGKKSSISLRSSPPLRIFTSEMVIPFLYSPQNPTPYEIRSAMNCDGGIPQSFETTIYLTMTEMPQLCSITLPETLESPTVQSKSISLHGDSDGTTAEIPLTFDFPVSMTVPSFEDTYWFSPKIFMSISRDSRFANSIENFMISHSHENGGFFVLNPIQPKDHVVEGEILFSPIHGSSGYDVPCDVRVTTREGRPSKSTTSRSRASPVARIDLSSSSTGLPIDILAEFVATLGSYGSVDSEGYITLKETSRFSVLPWIDFSVHLDDGVSALPLSLKPEKYLEATAYPLRYKLLVHEIRSNDQILLGHNILGDLAIFFDNTNTRIGFGVPLSS